MPAAFRVFSELDTFFGQSGQLLAGGSIKTYQAGTTTLVSTYGEESLSTDNGSTIALDSSGRPAVDMWASGSLFVEIFDADGVKQGEADDVQIPGGEATALPALSADKFLTNDGSVMSWAAIRQVPDPSGSASKVLGTDGSALTWVSQPTMPDPVDPEIVVNDAGKLFRAGVSSDATKVVIQCGSGSAPASGSRNTTGSVTFGIPFATLWAVTITQNHNGVTADGHVPSEAITTKSETGFTARFSTDENSTSSVWNIINSVPFMWTAIGTVEVTP